MRISLQNGIVISVITEVSGAVDFIDCITDNEDFSVDKPYEIALFRNGKIDYTLCADYGIFEDGRLKKLTPQESLNVIIKAAQEK